MYRVWHVFISTLQYYIFSTELFVNLIEVTRTRNFVISTVVKWFFLISKTALDQFIGLILFLTRFEK